MSVERIPVDDLRAFDALRPQWDALYRADPRAQVFLSFPWLRAFLPNAPHGWTILTLRERGELVAALPLSLRAAPHKRFPIARELTFASAPFADYQGMLCRPDREDAVAAFAQIVRATRWDRAALLDVRDPRIEALVAELGGSGFATRRTQGSPCSTIDLPASWDAFMASLSKGTRRGLSQPLNALGERLPASRFTLSTGGDAERHVDAVLALNKLRWGAAPGRVARYRGILLAAHEQGCLRVGVLWDGERAIGAGAVFFDEERGYGGLYLLAHDPEYGRHSPGKVVLAALIRDACERGYRTFDFLRGDEAYKQPYATRTELNETSPSRAPARARSFCARQPAYASLRTKAFRLAMRARG